jgi:hypothetical protein
MYQQSGIRILSLVDLVLVWANPAQMPLGQLTLLGLDSEVATTPGTQIIWGDEIFNATGPQQIIWGDEIFDSRDQQIIWGDDGSTDGYQIIWGDGR